MCPLEKQMLGDVACVWCRSGKKGGGGKRRWSEPGREKSEGGGKAVIKTLAGKKLERISILVNYSQPS